MNFAAHIPLWLDAFFIAPFRFVPWPEGGMWLGSGVLAIYCIVIGLLTGAILFLLHHRYFTSMEDTVQRYHNISVEALHSGNKEAYIGANKMAQEEFGKSFFAQAAIGMASLWPVPFALSWLSLRFEGIVIYESINAGYVFIFLVLYIVLRIFLGRLLSYVYPFSRVKRIKAEAKAARGKARAFFQPEA